MDSLNISPWARDLLYATQVMKAKQNELADRLSSDTVALDSPLPKKKMIDRHIDRRFESMAESAIKEYETIFDAENGLQSIPIRSSTIPDNAITMVPYDEDDYVENQKKRIME